MARALLAGMNTQLATFTLDGSVRAVQPALPKGICHPRPSMWCQRTAPSGGGMPRALTHGGGRCGDPWDRPVIDGIDSRSMVSDDESIAESARSRVENIIGIAVGFALTTVAGGWWAARLQERSWARQNEVQLRQAERERAGAACQELMSLLDRRLYRMQRLLWAASPGTSGVVDLAEVERRRQEYVEVLFAWNDRLNTNLSLVGSHFGDDARANLHQLYEDFKRAGLGVETVVRAARASEDSSRTARVVAQEFEGREVGSLNDQVYQFGLVLMGQLRDGRVGRNAPDISAPRRG